MLTQLKQLFFGQPWHSGVGSPESSATGAGFTSHCRADPRQLYRLELHFRQRYAFSNVHNAAGRGPPQSFPHSRPASLCLKSGKIIVYGTVQPIVRAPTSRSFADATRLALYAPFTNDAAVPQPHFVHACVAVRPDTVADTIDQENADAR
jgi:hypothetical protein